MPRPRKATTEKKKKGTLRPSRELRRAEGLYLDEAPDYPEWFGDLHREIFDMTIPGLIEKRHLTLESLPLLYAYIKAMARYWELEKMIDDLPSMLVPGRGEEIKLNPILREARTWFEKAQDAGKQFGLTPYAAKLVPGAPEGGGGADDDPASEWRMD